MTSDVTTQQRLRDLRARIEFLRNQEDSILSGSSKLLAYGITGHVDQAHATLDSARAEARRIADELASLGARADADNARYGWAIVLPPRPS